MSNSPTMKEALIFSNNPLAKAEFFRLLSAIATNQWSQLNIFYAEIFRSIDCLLGNCSRLKSIEQSALFPSFTPFDFCRVSCVSILVPHMPCVGAHQLLLLVVTKESWHMEKKVISLSRIELHMWSIARNFSLTFYFIVSFPNHWDYSYYSWFKTSFFFFKKF